MGKGFNEVPYDVLPDIPLNVEGTISNHVGTILEEAILDGVLPAGRHILPGELARRYGISIVPIREALRSLDARGWVEIRSHQGAFVRSEDPNEVADIFDSRLVIEPSLAVMAAEKRSAEDLRYFEELVQQGHEIASDEAGAAFARLNAKFHRRIAAAAGNSVLYRYQVDLNKCVRFYFSKVSQSRMLASAQEHDEIFSAIKDGNAELARELSVAHISRTKALLQVPLQP